MDKDYSHTNTSALCQKKRTHTHHYVVLGWVLVLGRPATSGQSLSSWPMAFVIRRGHTRVMLWSSLTTRYRQPILQKDPPWKGPPRFLTEGHMSMTKSGLACVYCI